MPDPTGKSSFEKLVHNNAMNARLEFSGFNKESGKREDNVFVKWIVGHSGFSDLPNFTNVEGINNIKIVVGHRLGTAPNLFQSECLN